MYPCFIIDSPTGGAMITNPANDGLDLSEKAEAATQAPYEYLQKIS
jgi:hypothetical protein